MSFAIVKNENLVPVQLEGRDRERYLQGRITQDIKSMAPSESRLALILSPQGKIEGKFSFSKLNEGFLLFVEVSEELKLENFLSALFRFKVADDVLAKDLSSEFTTYTLYSTDKVVLPFEELEEGGIIARDLQRGALYCVDLLLPNSLDESELLDILKMNSSASYEDYDLERIKAGFPLVGRDVVDNTLAPDLDISSYVSFKKGCYAGQEVVEMSIARGRPNRALVSIEAEGKLPDEHELKFYDQSLENNVGFVTSKHFDSKANKTFALGFIKTKYEPLVSGFIKDFAIPLKITKSY